MESLNETTRIVNCKSCGKPFIALSAQIYKKRSQNYCPVCSRVWRKEQAAQREEALNRKWREQKKAQRSIFLSRINDYPIVSLDDIRPGNHVLYVIGNGFDLMHLVPSGYYSFRDSMGKNSLLRSTLEGFLSPKDIWADFEGALAKFNYSAMGSRYIVDSWLDDFGAYDEDAGAAEYYMAVDAAATPITIISNELPIRFRKWVDTLTIGTDDRPLKNVIHDGLVLNFNYTEFIETMYGIPREHICYIHGCRRDKNNKLILGHQPGASDAAFLLDEVPRRPKTYRQALTDIAQGNVADRVSEYDKTLTKDCREIIENHRSFFEVLRDIDQIIVIGHSLSEVDWDYYKLIHSTVSKNAHWFFGCHGLSNLDNLDKLVDQLGLQPEQFSVFRTDEIRVKPKDEPRTVAVSSVPTTNAPKTYTLSSSQWKASISGHVLKITGKDIVPFEIVLPAIAKTAFFLPDENTFIVILNSVEANVLLFSFRSGNWSFVGELAGIPHQTLVNRRLRHVFFSDNSLSFVYNNRIRTYDLLTGALVRNTAKRNAASGVYPGMDIIDAFLSRLK